MTHIRVERDGAVGVLTIDRPERFNSLDVETARDFRKAGLALARDPAVRAVVLRRHPRRLLQRRGPEVHPVGRRTRRTSATSRARGREQTGYGEIFKQILEYIHSTISEIKRAPKPFVAAVDGVAGGRRLRDRDGLRPRLRLRARDLRVGVRQDRADGRGELDVLPAAPARPSPGDGARAPEPAARRRARPSSTASSTASSRPRPSTPSVRAIARPPRRGPDGGTRRSPRAWSSRRPASTGSTTTSTASSSELARIADGKDFAEGLEGFFAHRPARFGGGS